MTGDSTVLILAAGEDPWWGGVRDPEDTPDIRPALLPIAGELLIVRTQRQCARLGYRPIVVSNHPEILAVAERSFVPKACGKWLNTVWSTRELWKGWTIMLFGDVVWSDHILALALKQRKSPLFILGHGGIHAWMFRENDVDMIADIISTLLEKKHHQSDLFQQLGGKGSPVHMQLPADGGFTMDFDYYREYLKWLGKHGP